MSTIQVDDCATEAEYIRHGNRGSTTFPSIGTAGSHSDGYIDWYEPIHDAGDLLLWVYMGTKTNVSLPAGYTAPTNSSQLWDNAPIASPFNSAPGPFYEASVQTLIGYRIATADWNTGDTVVGTISGLEYSDPVGVGTEDGEVVVYCFRCYQMPDFTTTDWPATPVKVGTLDSANAQLFDDPDYIGQNGNAAFENRATISGVTADHVGNHTWISFLGTHGITLASDPSDMAFETELIVDPSAGDFGSPAFYVGDRYNQSGWAAYVNHGGFTGVDPEEFNTVYTDGNQDVFTYPGDSWNDGFIGTLHVDYEDWSVLGGVFALQVLIQGPPAHRPINDDFANAYAVDCGNSYVQCTVGATLEASEPDPSGSAFGSLWYQWTPDSDETGVVINVYDDFALSALTVYTGASLGALTQVVTAEGGGTFPVGTTVTFDVTAGTTYWIQLDSEGDWVETTLELICNQAQAIAFWGTACFPVS